MTYTCPALPSYYNSQGTVQEYACNKNHFKTLDKMQVFIFFKKLVYLCMCLLASCFIIAHISHWVSGQIAEYETMQ